MSSPYDDLVGQSDTTTSGEKKMGKGLFQSKTIWVNLLTAAVSIGTYLTDSSLFTDNPQFVAIAGTIIGVANVILRVITKEPITGVSKAKAAE